MELAYISFRQILTMLILMGIGVVCEKVGLINEETNKRLVDIVLLLLGPMVLFLSYQRPFEAELAWWLLLTAGLSALAFGVGIAFSHIVYRIIYGRHKNCGVDIFASAYPNAGFIGIPLLQGILGYESIFFLSVYIGVFAMFMWTHGAIVMGGGFSPSKLRKALVGTPMLSVFIGIGFFLVGIELPDIVYTPMRMMANANIPMAMLAAGVTLAKSDVPRLLRNKRAYIATFMRLVAVPALTIAIISSMTLPPIVAGTILVAISCPAAANLIFFAYRFDADVPLAADIFALSTVASIITIPLMLLFI